MAFRSTFRPTAGPFTLNTGTKGPTSATVRLFGITFRLWDRKGRTGVSSVDLPGPLSYRPSLAERPSPASSRTATAPWGMNPKYRP